MSRIRCAGGDYLIGVDKDRNYELRDCTSVWRRGTRHFDRGLASGDVHQLQVLILAYRVQPPERLRGTGPGAAADQANGLIDHRPVGQRCL